MQYRELGKTGHTVSAIGLGCAQLGSPNADYAVRLVRRALDLGVTYIDLARGYRDAEIKVGLALRTSPLAVERESRCPRRASWIERILTKRSRRQRSRKGLTWSTAHRRWWNPFCRMDSASLRSLRTMFASPYRRQL